MSMRDVVISLATVFFLVSFPANALATDYYGVDFKLLNSSANSYDALDITVDYSATGGSIGGLYENGWCSANSGLGALVAFNNDDPILKAGFAHLSGIEGPVVLFTCVFFTDGSTPQAADFDIDVTNWNIVEGSQAPFVWVSNIEQY